MILYTIRFTNDNSTFKSPTRDVTIENAIAELVRLQSLTPNPLAMFCRLSLGARRVYRSERGAVGVIKVYDTFAQTVTSYRLDRSKTAVEAIRVEMV